MNNARVLLHLARLGIRREFQNPIALGSQLIFLIVILWVFSHLWNAAFASGFVSGSLPGDYVWYLFSNELILLSVPQVFRPMAQEMRSGDVLHHFLRPISYPLMIAGDAAGVITARFLAFAPVGIILTYLYTGNWPKEPLGLAATIVLFPLATAAILLSLILIGMGSSWLFDVVPVYWVYQKLLFVFGGLLLPLTIYPSWMQTLAKFTPFYAFLFGVSRNTLQWEASAFITSLFLLLFWALLAALMVRTMYGALGRRLLVAGG